MEIYSSLNAEHGRKKCVSNKFSIRSIQMVKKTFFAWNCAKLFRSLKPWIPTNLNELTSATVWSISSESNWCQFFYVRFRRWLSIVKKNSGDDPKFQMSDTWIWFQFKEFFDLHARCFNFFSFLDFFPTQNDFSYSEEPTVI